MTMQELATAKQIGANMMVIVVDNGMYGTIRMHQKAISPVGSSILGLLILTLSRLVKPWDITRKK